MVQYAVAVNPVAPNVQKRLEWELKRSHKVVWPVARYPKVGEVASKARRKKVRAVQQVEQRVVSFY